MKRLLYISLTGLILCAVVFVACMCTACYRLAFSLFGVGGIDDLLNKVVVIAFIGIAVFGFLTLLLAVHTDSD